MTHQVSQGFRYQWAHGRGHLDVIALETSVDSLHAVKVLRFDEAKPWYHAVDWALPEDLEVQPSRYLHGATPK